MIALILAAVVTAPAQPPELRPAIRPPAVHVNAPAAARRVASQRRPPDPPVLSPPIDPYRGEASFGPARFDPQHPSLAPESAEPEGAGEGLGRVSPVPPDPWASTLGPPPPPGTLVTPRGGGG